MADPLNNLFSVRACPPTVSSKSDARIASDTQKRRDFFGSLGKVGDLEILNNSGVGSEVGKGLRTLASISNSVRTGCGSLPTSIGGMVDSALGAVSNGASWVLEQTGIPMDKLEAVSQFSPQIANQALGQAESIYEQVRRGRFKVTDIPNVFQDLQNLERLSRNIFTPQSWFDRNKFPKLCEASPYARDLVAKAPKFKFLFIVQFIFNNGYSGLSNIGSDFAFVVKRSTRPNVRFETRDLNYYNFRSKLITRTAFDDMTMTFHDDGSGYNSATEFVTAYMRAYSPITNIPSWEMMTLAEQSGMDFESAYDFNGTSYQLNSASRGVLSSDAINVLQEIRLFHIFDYGQAVNVYHFFNPRITLLNQDDVDMSVGSEGNEVQITFNYDSVYTALNQPMSEIEGTIADIQGATTATYKIRNVDTQEKAAIPPTYSPTSAATPSTADCTPANPTTSSKLPPFATPGIFG